MFSSHLNHRLTTALLFRPAGLVVGLLCGIALASVVGCGKSGDTQSLRALLKQSGDDRASLFPLAGRVMIDGEPAHYVKPQRLVMMLYDKSKPDLPTVKRPFKDVSADGTFAFGTYTKGDGLPAGDFVVAFAVLEVTNRGLLGPDQLHNLYNDPEKNAANPEFNINHSAPGKTDYVFDLKVEGKEGIATPGPKALTEVRPQ
jgi:hypothetical protein